MARVEILYYNEEISRIFWGVGKFLKKLYFGFLNFKLLYSATSQLLNQEMKPPS
jgi:hypothetical protein